MRSQLTDANITGIIGTGDWAADYAYHDSGNIASRTIQSSTESFSYDGHLMKDADGNTLDYDENGNMKTGVSATLVYNWDNKLRSAEKGSDSISLKYDPSGSRIYKNSSVAGARKYIVDILGDLPVILLELDVNNAIKKTYIYANSQIIAQHAGDHEADRYFYLHDRLGSVRQVIDTSGNVKNMYTYEPFGETLEEQSGTGAPSNSFMFTGQFFDSEVDEYYLRARQYDPYIGRFTSRDPVFGQFEEPLTLHAYIYCINDPVNKMDIWGLDSVALYDPKGRIGPDRVESADDYDHAIPVSNIRHALIELLILTFIEEVRIDDLYVFGHGMPGLQTVGGSPLLPYTQEWVAIAGTVEKTGAIHLRGCSVAAGSSGLTYLLNLANMGQRRITAFDEFVQHFGEERWGADYWSPGKLYMAVPNRGYKVISEGGWWREFYRRGRR